MSTRRTFLMGATALAAFAVTGIPTLAVAEERRIFGGKVGYGAAKLNDALDGKVELHNVLTIAVSPADYTHVTEHNHILEIAAAEYPLNDLRRKHLQRRQDTLRHLIADGVLVTTPRLGLSDNGWCELEYSVPAAS